MKTHKIIFVILLFCVFSCHTKQNAEILLEKGVSRDLAEFRKKQVSDIVYHLKFDIPLNIDEPIDSKLVLNLQVNSLENPLYLDFNEDQDLLKEVFVNGDSIVINHQKEHLIIEQEHLEKGANEIIIKFNSGESSLNRNPDFLYTLLVPDRASTLFPCFDQPNLKAHYKLDITAPKTWQVLCGSPVEKEENLGNYTRRLFKLSDKMSTYLFSFVAGVFKEAVGSKYQVESKLLYREDNEKKIRASIEDIFKLHQESVDFLEEYTDYDFPFQKLDYACIPGFQYGGMEHVGAIQYRESSLFLDESATMAQQLNRARLIGHETSHMWFGDLVTMDWFDDVWLKEVFANFMADKITKSAYPEINHDLQFVLTHYPSAYSEDRTKGTNPIKQKLKNLKNAGTLYGRIIYNKAPLMMRQLESIMGEEAFKNGLQDYIVTYANSNADWNDLVLLLDDQTEIDLKKWSAVWVNKSGRPILTDRIAYAGNRIKSFEIFQTAEDGSGNLWPQTFDIGLVYKDSIYVTPINLSDKITVVNSFNGLPKPESIIYNYNGLGYGVFPINEMQLRVSQIKDDVARAYAYINLYENFLVGAVSNQEIVDELTLGLTSEKEELIVKLISNYISSVFWSYSTDIQRNQFQGHLETILRERLNSNLSSGLKKTLYNLYKSIAYSEKGKAFLYDVWSKKEILENVSLNENDYINLAATLAIYKHEEAKQILSSTNENIGNIDRKKRFEFLLPSLSDQESVRDNFMNALASSKNREKESWVLTALGYIHHPLRQKSSEKHLKRCLDLLEEIQLTGDIFFPKGWLNATIGNYSSTEAFVILKTFLNNNPELNPVLKNKILQASDGLFRSESMRSHSSNLNESLN